MASELVTDEALSSSRNLNQVLGIAHVQHQRLHHILPVVAEGILHAGKERLHGKLAANADIARHRWLAGNVLRPLLAAANSACRSGSSARGKLRNRRQIRGCFGMRASAAAISFCSSADGVHTFSMLTFTCGCDAGGVAGAPEPRPAAPKQTGETGQQHRQREFVDAVLSTFLGTFLGTAEF